MKIARISIPAKGYEIPAIEISPEAARGSVAVIHGYGGNKEEMLGLAWRIAEAGFRAVSIDLAGHGEHPLPFSVGITGDVGAAIAFCAKRGPAAAVGHSLGGRLALLSGADCAIGISPALARQSGEQTKNIIMSFRGHRVRTEKPDLLFDILGELPPWNLQMPARAAVFGSRDVPEIITECRAAKEKGADVVELDQSMHGDIFNQEKCLEAVTDTLKDRVSKL